MDAVETPLVIQCIYCHATLTLNKDSMEARGAGTDPHQQMRTHILHSHLTELSRHQYNVGWITDMLFFRAPSDRARWQANIVALLKHYLEAE